MIRKLTRTFLNFFTDMASAFYKRGRKWFGKPVKSYPDGVNAPGLEKARQWIQELPARLSQLTEQEVEAVANKFKDMVQEAVWSQQYKWVPLNARYLAWKIRKGRDPRILLATHEYINAIVVTKSKDKKGVYFEIGLPDIIHKDSQMPIRKLARIHEFGTRRIPARPLWRPTWARFKKTAGKDISKSVRASLLSEWKKLQKTTKGATPGFKQTKG